MTYYMACDKTPVGSSPVSKPDTPVISVPDETPTGRPYADIENEIVEQINALRATTGQCLSRLLGSNEIVIARDIWGPVEIPLRPYMSLTDIASLYANDLNQNGLGVPHVSSDGKTLTDRFKVFEKEWEWPGLGVKYPMRWEGYSENVTIFHESDRTKVAKRAVTNWRDSPDGHCQNQWNSSWFFIGAAVDGKPDEGHWVAVTVYARPVGGGPGIRGEN